MTALYDKAMAAGIGQTVFIRGESERRRSSISFLARDSAVARTEASHSSAILNLTQHAATPEQIAAGVVDLPTRHAGWVPA